MPEQSAVPTMNERQPLSFQLAAADLATTEPIVPFPAFRGEDPCIVTAVLERTAICGSTTDHYERMAVKHQDVLVDPAMVEWKARAATVTKQNGQPTPWLGRSKKASSEERQAAREKSDRKARENQAEVARTLAAERVRDVELRSSDRGPSPVVTKAAELLAAQPSDVKESPSNLEAKSEPLKFCPGCKHEKPKSAFPTGKGFFACNECRAKAAPGTKPPHTQAQERNLELAQEGKKRCGSCKRELPVEAFNRNASKPDGLQAICRECVSERWTAGSTHVRRRKAPKAAKTVAPSATVHRKNGRPALTFKELLDDLKKLRTAYDKVKEERDQLLDERSQLYGALHEVTDGI